MQQIKFLALACLFMLVSQLPLAAQAADAKVTNTQIVDVSADLVWAVLRKMDDIDKYSSGVEKVDWSGAHGVGGQRVCTAPGGQGRFVESIVKFDDTTRSYSYALVEGVPAKGMVNSFKVVDLGYQKCMIVWTSTFDQFVENPQMTEAQFMGFLDMASTEMLDKVAAEATKRS